MRINGSSSRSGTATILGTIIFIGIMFTAVIPMLIFMRQADTLHEMRKHEVKIIDEERRAEDIHVYVYNDTDSSENLTLRVENWGDFSVSIDRIWINDTYYPLDDFNVQAMNWHEEELTSFNPVSETRYFIKVATDRGNVFFTESGSIYCDEYGIWKDENFALTFYISAPGVGWFDIEIKDYAENILTDPPFSIHKSGVDDTVVGYFSVPSAGTYHVKITRRNVGVIYIGFVTIRWPDGPKIEPVQV